METMKFDYYEREYNLFLRVDTYTHTGNVAIEVWDAEEGPFAELTVNIAPLPEWYAAIDTNNFPDAIKLIEEYKLGEPIGQTLRSGYCEYPIYKLDNVNIRKYMEDVD